MSKLSDKELASFLKDCQSGDTCCDYDAEQIIEELLALRKVAEATLGVVQREDIGGYGFEGLPEVRAAIKAWESL